MSAEVLVRGVRGVAARVESRGDEHGEWVVLHLTFPLGTEVALAAGSLAQLDRLVTLLADVVAEATEPEDRALGYPDDSPCAGLVEASGPDVEHGPGCTCDDGEAPSTSTAHTCWYCGHHCGHVSPQPVGPAEPEDLPAIGCPHSP